MAGENGRWLTARSTFGVAVCDTKQGQNFHHEEPTHARATKRNDAGSEWGVHTLKTVLAAVLAAVLTAAFVDLSFI